MDKTTFKALEKDTSLTGRLVLLDFLKETGEEENKELINRTILEINILKVEDYALKKTRMSHYKSRYSKWKKENKILLGPNGEGSIEFVPMNSMVVIFYKYRYSVIFKKSKNRNTEKTNLKSLRLSMEEAAQGLKLHWGATQIYAQLLVDILRSKILDI